MTPDPQVHLSPDHRLNTLHRVRRTVLIQVTVAATLLGAGSAILRNTVPTHTAPPPAVTGACHPGPPLKGVHDPNRLQIVNPCAFVEGTILCHDSGPATDGDHHVVVRLDTPYQHELTATNRLATCGARGGPYLIIEIIPQACRDSSIAAHLIGDPDNCADKAGFIDPVLPAPGTHVAIIGPLVLDQNHPVKGVGWTEIHPTERIITESNPQTPHPNSTLCLPGGGDQGDGAAPPGTSSSSPTATSAPNPQGGNPITCPNPSPSATNAPPGHSHSGGAALG